VYVTPKGTQVTWIANSTGHTATFTVQNTGNTANGYSFTCTTTGPVTCDSVRPTGATVLKNGSVGVTATYDVGAAGSGVLTLTAVGHDGGSGTVQDNGTYNVTVTAPPTPGVSVTPHGGTAPTRTPNTGGYSETFTITNTGNVPITYTLSCTTSSNVTCTRISLTSVALSAGAATTDTAYYNVGAPGTGTLSLTASGGGVSDVGSYNVPVVSYGVAVTPKGATSASRLANTSGYAETFTVTNTGSASNVYSVTCAGSSNVTCTGVSAGTDTLSAGASVVDTARYSVGAVGMGALTLTASGTSASDAASYSIPVVSASPQPPLIDVTSVNPGAATKRGVCLTIAIGAAAAAECGDLRIVHPLPTTRTLNKARTPTLLYNTQFAHPFPLVAANVTLPATAVIPDSITGTLTINAVGRARGKWLGTEWTPGKTRRVVLGFDGLTDATGIYSYTVEFRTWYPSTNQPTTVSVLLPIVNRNGSPFGAGWWLAGLERLDVGTMIWVGGDGSVRQYQPVRPNVWAAPNVDHADTLRREANGTFLRYDRDSVRVRFDTTGLHIATINRQGHTTTFSYASGRLTKITLPPDTTKVYRFTYDGSGLLQSVSAPGPDGVTPRITRVTVTGGRVTAIVDPDSTMVSFGYDPNFTNRLKSRTDRRGTVTTYGFDVGSKLAVDSINMGAGRAPIITSLMTLESRGLPGVGVPTSVDTAVAYTKFDGARTDVGDTALFWLDRFGAPRKIVDALGNATLLTRGNSRWPALVTRMRYPSGQIIGATYDSLRANILSSTDSSSVQASRYATTQYEWDPKWDAVRKITRPEGDSAIFGYDPVTGNMQWQEDGSGPVSQVTFGYNAANQVVSITQPNTPPQRIVYDALGNLDSVTTPLGYLTTYQSDSAGRLMGITSPIDAAPTSTRREVQQIFYDKADRDTLTISAGPAMSPTVPAETAFVRKRYTPNSQLDSLSRWARTDIRSVGTVTTRWKYDAANRPIVEIAPDGLPDSMFYDPAGNDTLKVTRRQLRITMAYDVLNRLRSRTVPPFTYGPRSSGIQALSGLPTSYASYQVPGDAQTFTYDAMGRLLTANNADARVKRTYYTTGLLETDSLWIRTVQDTVFAQHAYGSLHSYDLDGRRTGLGVPSQLDPQGVASIWYRYNSGLGALGAVVQPVELSIYKTVLDIVGFAYSPRGEVASVDFTGQYTQLLAYDADGRMISDTVRNLGGTDYPRFGADPIRAIAYGYDGRDKLVSGADPLAYKDSITMSYSGLGHVVESSFSERYKTIFSGTANCGSARYSVVETFRDDAMGNRAHWTRQEATTSFGCSPADSGGGGHEYLPRTGRLVHDTTQGGVATYWYNGAGDVEFSQNLGAPAQEQASYYGADGRLRASDTRRAIAASPHFGWWTRALDEYRYDALGRRIWVRSRKSCQEGSTMSITEATECQTSILRRVVWDADQVLVEIQMPGDSTARDLPYWENDTAAVQLAPIPAGCCSGDPSRYFGRVVYAHGNGLDHPVTITRYNYVYAINDSGFTVSPPAVVPWVRIEPFWNVFGDAALGAFRTGGAVYCTPPTSTKDCVGVYWPYSFSAYDREHGNTGRTNWHGSLLENAQDKSGLQFKRNRYYDPQTGRFTQEDPIGLAGGLNLYGFAGGDPVNFSDPFGLCPSFPGTTVPCELIAAVFSEASRSARQQSGIAHAIINRATDPNEHRHPYGGYRNTGDYETDVARQASTRDIQGTGNNQYRSAMDYIDNGEALDQASMGKLNSVAEQSEAAYTGRSDDPTGGATFWSHDPKRTPKANCSPKPTTKIDGAQFFTCSN